MSESCDRLHRMFKIRILNTKSEYTRELLRGRFNNIVKYDHSDNFVLMIGRSGLIDYHVKFYDLDKFHARQFHTGSAPHVNIM